MRIPGLAMAAVLAALLAGCTSAAFPGLSQILPRPAQHPPAAEAAALVPVEGAADAAGEQTLLALAEPAAAAAGSEAGSLAAPAAATDIDRLIVHYAGVCKVPEALVRRVVARESGYNPRARNGPYYGLMQIRYETAQSMGYRGPAGGLLEPDTNLRYGVKYLSGAYVVGGRNQDQAVRNFVRGYYYDAKRRGLLREIGLL